MLQPGSELDLLKIRLARLEQQHRWLKQGFFGMLASLGCLALLAAEVPKAKEVSAEKFTLTDKGGKTRAELGMWKGGPFLTFYDDQHIPRMAMLMRGNTLLFQLMDNKKRTRAGLSFDNDIPQLTISDEAGYPRVVLSYWKKEPVIEIRAEKGIVRGGLKVMKTGEPVLQMFDPKNMLRLEMVAGTEEAALKLGDDRQKGRMILTTKKDAAMIGILDKNQVGRLGIVVNETTPTFFLADAKEQIITEWDVQKNRAGFRIRDAMKKVLFEKP
jgi:hypothetical protein